MREKNDLQIKQVFRLRQARQLFAIGLALFLVFSLAVLYKYPILGKLSKNAVFGAQGMVIASFIGFTSSNWRCPSCNKYLGNDIIRRICGKCGSRLR